MGIKISQLPVASTSQDIDIIPIVQAGVTKQIQKSIFNQNINEEIETIQQDISDIQEEQTTQNENIQDNADNIIALTEKHNKEIEALENMLPKSTATGEYITLNNSADYKFRYFNNGGNTEQESYSGKNLFDLSAFLNFSRNNDYYELYDNDKLKIKNNGDSRNWDIINSGFLVKPSTTYYFSATAVSGTNPRIQIILKDSNYNNIGSPISIGLGNSFTTTNDTSYISIKFFADNNGVLSNIQLEEGNSKTSYEPYVGSTADNITPSPNPDYPQKVNNVGSNVNLFDKSETPLTMGNVTETELSTGIKVTLTSATIMSPAYMEIENINSLLGKTLILSSKITPSGNNIGLIRVYWLNSNNNYSVVGNYLAQLSDSGSITFIIPNQIPTNATHLAILFYGNGNQSTGVSIGDYVDYTEVKLEEGSTATGYTPYNRGGIDVKVENKNLFNIENITNASAYGLSSSINTNKELVINGTVTGSGNMYPNTLGSSSLVKIGNLKAGTYSAKGVIKSGTITRSSSDIAIVFFTFVNKAQSNIVQVTGTNLLNSISKNFTLTEDTEVYFTIFVNNVSGGSFVANNAVIDLQIEQGSTASSYIAHAEQNITIPLPEGMELCKIGEYNDKIFHNIPSNPMYNSSLVEGGWYKYGMIGEKIFKGNEDIRYNTSFNDTVLFALLDDTCYLVTDFSVNYVLSNYLLGTNRQNVVSNLPNTIALGNNNRRFFLNVTRDIVGDTNTEATLNSNVKAWLTELYNNERPLIAYYVLATPTYTPITDTDTLEALNTLENFTTYQGQTNISSDNIPSPIFDIEYFLVQNSYSYDEHEVGTWLNGETLYRKTYKYTDLSASAEYIDIGTLPSNITVVGISGVNITPSVGITRQLPFINDYSSLSVMAITNESKLRLYKTGTFIVADDSVIVTIEYIKN